MMLHEQLRPTDFDGVIGNPKAVGAARRLAESGVGGSAILITGPSGTGKTTIAKILAATIAGKLSTIEDVAARQTPASIEKLHYESHYYGLGEDGKNGRAIIINEAHRLALPVLSCLNEYLESIPSHVVWIFTTTADALETHFDLIEGPMFLSRCARIRLTNQGLAKPFAEYVRGHAVRLGLDGKELSAYVALANETNNSLRAMISAVQSGRMKE